MIRVVDGWAGSERVSVNVDPLRVEIDGISQAVERVDTLRDGGTRIVRLAGGRYVVFPRRFGDPDRTPRLDGVPIVEEAKDDASARDTAEATRAEQYAPWNESRERHILEMNSHGIADTHSIFDVVYELKATRIERDRLRERNDRLNGLISEVDETVHELNARTKLLEDAIRPADDDATSRPPYDSRNYDDPDGFGCMP